jgi:hypothetical protein
MIVLSCAAQGLAATFSMASKWTNNTQTVNDVTITFDGSSTSETGYFKMVKGGYLNISVPSTSTNIIRRITINYVDGYYPQDTTLLVVDNPSSCIFYKGNRTKSSTWWGAKQTVTFTNGSASSGSNLDLRISSIVVTTNSDMQLYKVTQQAIDPSGITHAANTTDNSTAVGITYGTGFLYNSKDDKVEPLNTTTYNAEVYKAMGYIWETNSQTMPNVSIGTQNIIPRTGAYYILEPTQSGEITVYMCHFSKTTIYVLESGKIYKRWQAPDANNNTRTWYTFKVRAGYKYYLYSRASTGYASPLYGFEFIPQTTRSSQYMVANGETFYNHKTIRSVDDITMTFGGWLSETNARQSDILANNSSTYGSYTDTWTAAAGSGYTAINGFQYVTGGNGNDPTDELTDNHFGSYYKNPCRGTYYKFEPRKNGWLNVYVVQEARTLYFTDENGKGKQASYYSVDASNLTIGTDSGYTVKAKGFYEYSFYVNAGQTYFLYAAGSKLGFAGFEFNLNERDLGSMAINSGNGTVQFNPYTNVTFTRTLTKNRWNSLVLPFSMNEAQVRETFGEGTTIMQFDDVANNTIKFKQHYYQYIVAGQPCLIFPTGGWDAVADSSNHDQVTSFTMKQVSVRSDNAGLKDYKSTTTTGYTMKGIYAASTTVPAVSYWLIANNTIGR